MLLCVDTLEEMDADTVDRKKNTTFVVITEIDRLSEIMLFHYHERVPWWWRGIGCKAVEQIAR